MHAATCCYLTRQQHDLRSYIKLSMYITSTELLKQNIIIIMNEL